MVVILELGSFFAESLLWTRLVWCQAGRTSKWTVVFFLVASIHETTRRQSVWWVITNNNYQAHSAAKRENWASGGSARGTNGTLWLESENPAWLSLLNYCIYIPAAVSVRTDNSYFVITSVTSNSGKSRGAFMRRKKFGNYQGLVLENLYSELRRLMRFSKVM